MERSELVEALKTSTKTVTFTKKDGTERVMKCTRNMSDIPVESHPKGELEVVSTDNIRVYDLEANAWRSFNYSTVKEVV